MYTLPNKIVCAIDFSEFTEFVIQICAGVARRINATLLLLHTIYHPKDALYGTADFEHSGERINQKRIALNRMHQLMDGKQLSWQPVVLFGDPVVEIPKYADNHQVDLIVAVSHDISGIKRLLIGTVVERLARQLTQPLLVVKASKQQRHDAQALLQPGSNMIICCDLRADAGKLIEYGLRWALEFRFSVTLLHALEAPIDADDIDSATAPYNDAQKLLQKKINAKILAMVPSAYVETVPFEVRTIAGQATETLLDMATKIGASLCVVGVRYHNIFDKLIVGSTTEMILRHAPCSVLTVNIDD